MKKIIAVFCTAVLITSMLAACSNSQQTSGEVQSSADSTSTTESTTMRTTEDLSTTFKEAETNKVYPALKKDFNSSFPYETASYSTYYLSSNETRTKNIHEAVEHLNGVVIPAGKTFSFNQTVGKRTVLAGYQAAKVVQGDEFVDGLGGGICQVSSTVFQSVLRANLQIKVRACHSLEISYVPLGGDATVQWNSQDFQFVNNSNCDIRLIVTANDGTLTCTVEAKEDIKPDKVDIKIKKDGKSYVLTRSVNGTVNYTTYSKYAKPKSATTTKKDSKNKKKTTTKKSDKNKDKKSTKAKKKKS